MLKSKLSTQYPMEQNWQKYIIFVYDYQQGVDPIFLMRTAAFVRDVGKGKKLTVYGARTYDQQANCYITSGGKFVNGEWVGGDGTASKPGTSLHEYRLALDGLEDWFKVINQHSATSQQNILLKYGIFKPLTKGNKKTVCENWHFQPVETIGIEKSQLYKLAPEVVDVMEVKEFQMITGLQPDDKKGPITKAKAMEMLKICQDIVGNNFQSAEEVINATQGSPRVWLAMLKIKYFDSFVMNIYKKMRGE